MTYITGLQEVQQNKQSDPVVLVFYYFVLRYIISLHIFILVPLHIRVVVETQVPISNFIKVFLRVFLVQINGLYKTTTSAYVLIFLFFSFLYALGGCGDGGGVT
jgi:hypothetical protein